MASTLDEHRLRVLNATRQAGCTCDPEITLTGIPRHGMVTPAAIKHDLDCALLEGPRPRNTIARARARGTKADRRWRV